VAYAASDRGS